MIIILKLGKRFYVFLECHFKKRKKSRFLDFQNPQLNQTDNKYHYIHIFQHFVT